MPPALATGKGAAFLFGGIVIASITTVVATRARSRVKWQVPAPYIWRPSDLGGVAGGGGPGSSNATEVICAEVAGKITFGLVGKVRSSLMRTLTLMGVNWIPPSV